MSSISWTYRGTCFALITRSRRLLRLAGNTTQAVFGTVNMLERLVRQKRPAMLAVAMDSTTPTFRKEIYAEYKAHRPPQPPDLSQQMRRCREIVAAFAIPVFQKDGVEADDLIASAAAQRARAGGAW